MAAGLRMHMRHAEGGDTGEIQTHGDDSGAPSATGHDPDTVACTHHTLIIGINDYPHLHHGDADGLLGAVIDTKLWLEIARVRAGEGPLAARVTAAAVLWVCSWELQAGLGGPGCSKPLVPLCVTFLCSALLVILGVCAHKRGGYPEPHPH